MHALSGILREEVWGTRELDRLTLETRVPLLA